MTPEMGPVSETEEPQEAEAPEIPRVTGEPPNGLLVYCLLWAGITASVLVASYVLHCDLQAIVATLEALNETPGALK